MFSTAHNVSLADVASGVQLLIDGILVATLGNDGKLVLQQQASGPASPYHGLQLDAAFKLIVA